MEGITGIDHENGGSAGFVIFRYGGNGCESEVLIIITMRVVGVDNHDLTLKVTFLPLPCDESGSDGDHQDDGYGGNNLRNALHGFLIGFRLNSMIGGGDG